MPPTLFFLFMIMFAIHGQLFFHMNFKTDFSIYGKNDIGIWMVVALNLQIAFRSTAIFKILILHEHVRSFHYLQSLPQFFLQCFILLLQSSFSYLVKIIPK
jgi:hypothetical protein